MYQDIIILFHFIKERCFKDKTSSKLIEVTPKLLHFTKMCDLIHFLPQIYTFYTDISAISVTFCNSANNRNIRDRQNVLFIHMLALSVLGCCPLSGVPENPEGGPGYSAVKYLPCSRVFLHTDGNSRFNLVYCLQQYEG